VRKVIQVVTSQTSDLRSQISDLRSQISDLRSQISDLRSQISDLRFQISDLRFQINRIISISELKISDLRSQISDLTDLRKSQIHYPHPRAGASGGSCAYRSGSSFCSSFAASVAAPDGGTGNWSEPLAFLDESTMLNSRSDASFFFPCFA
jgi:cell division protein FtsL